MKLFLNVELTRKAQHHLQSPIGGEEEFWYVCPVCCWVALWVARYPSPSCPRPAGDYLAAMTAAGSAARYSADCTDTDVVWVEDIAPRVADTLSTALRLGGTNAVIGLLDSLEPIDIGLDDPGGKPHLFYFYEVRPGSAKDDDEGSWYCTYHESGQTMRHRTASARPSSLRKR